MFYLLKMTDNIHIKHYKHSVINENTILSKCIIKKYDSSIYNDECPISLEKINIGDMIIQLPCNHIFKEDNLKKWLKEKHNCPICRYNIMPNDKNIEIIEEYNWRQHSFSHFFDRIIQYLSDRLICNENVELDSLEEIFEIY